MRRVHPAALAYTWRAFSGMARLRAFWHRHVRGYEYEVCQHCGRPVLEVWWCHDDRLWEVVTGREKPSGKEAAGGVWCISCFNSAAQRHVDWIEWAPVNLQHLRRESA